ncbi:MAG: DsbA family protein [Nanoarchaeota archaeon]
MSEEHIQMKKDQHTKHKGKKVTLELHELTLWRAGTIVFAVLFLISILTGGFGGGTGGGTQINIPQQQQPQQGPQQPVVANLDLGGEELKLGAYVGDKNAPVKILTCEDYQCPFCKKFVDQTFSQLKKDYIDTGKVLYVYGDFPLSFHTESDEMHEAANCVGEQDPKKYWEMHDLIFSKQQEWGGQSDPAGKARAMAEELGVDVVKYDACIKGGKQKDEIQKDIQECTKAGTSGTPTFYINGKQLVGAQPFNAFKTIIDAELSK